MFNSEHTGSYHIEELGASYRICLISGLILLGAFFYLMFFDPNAAITQEKPSGIVSVLVCFAPSASSAMLLSSKTLGTFPEAAITATLAFHLLSMFWITFHIIKKIPVPHNSIVLVTRIWTFTSIGLLILAIVFFLFAMFHGGNNDRR